MTSFGNEQGEIYVFIGLAQEDGSLLIYETNSNIPLESNIDKLNINESEVVKQYEEAYTNQIVHERQRFKSLFDASAQ